VVKSINVLALMILIIGVLGCGDSGISIQGQITVNGQPLETAEIKFLPMDAVSSEHVGAVVTNGQYEVESSDRIQAGEYQVQIRAYRSSGKQVWDGMGDGKTKNMVDHFGQFIPNRYNDASELKVTLQPGKNEFNSDLKIAGQ
jgi:hypothetical protein